MIHKMNAIPVASSLLCHLDNSGKHNSGKNVSLSISIVFCISAAVLQTSSCFARSLVSSFVVFFMPPPRTPIMTGTIVIVYPGLLSLISKASCRYRVSLSVRFVSMFCCMGHAMSQIQSASDFSAPVSSPVFSRSRFSSS